MRGVSGRDEGSGRRSGWRGLKKRLNKNRYRSILLARGGRYWIYQYLFAKQDRANIEDDELEDFRTLAKSYAKLDETQIARLLVENDLMEICHDSEN